ncbi:Iron(III) dicitrate transport protein FecA [Candidatus Ornithobacterium hominis]|uniref:TonB-dependent receptor family protein n=1 Tax=Candidatus Ornithobacterium hominis TaxID=2497989 RepID=UPI0024BD111D|nr:TonB-dependent receptor [Candidatus Ornithobacterium hominis]CAI9429680.1 Iron(III) dicitrate transport protein FecA [Candidatus Ornithobacterium hominis]
MTKRNISAVCLYIACSCLYAQEEGKTKTDSTTIVLKELVISSRQMLGSKFEAQNRVGSAYYISPEDLQRFGYTDINRVLQEVPGVNVYEEDGYGLRPNISLRGTKAERSAKITLMEDGVLVAPAPYSAPAAYYFPNISRMSAVEVLKGSSQVQYGPFTTGGAINLVSSDIPKSFKAKLNATYGTNNTYKGHINIGDRFQNFGYMVEYLRNQSDGFKRFENGKKAGFKRNDVVAKLMTKTADNKHSFELKFGFADENSDETYVGLSQQDFERNPYLRYAGSGVDNMKTEHAQWVGSYTFKPSNYFVVSTQVYKANFNRNWYKLNDIKAGVGKNEKRSIYDVLEDPTTNQDYFDILTGKKDYAGESLIVRANNRKYLSQGAQTKIDYHFNINDLRFDAELGLRYHEDNEKRFQWDDSYAMEGGKMKLFLPGIHGTQANRLTSAKAFASYFLGKVKYNSLLISAGLRYEDIDLLKKDFGKNDIKSTGKDRIESKNQARVLIPSFGLNYKITPEISVFSGIHKGFSPPSAGNAQKPENSTNIELGTRLNFNRLRLELVGFRNDYTNMLGSDLAAAGGTGTLEQFDVGEALVRGAEFILQYQPVPERFVLKIPIAVSYTYTDTEIQNTFQEGSWGRVFEGDEIPYINRHSLNTTIGLEYKGFELNLSARHNDDMRTKPGKGKIAERLKIPAHTIFDASAKAKINSNIAVTVNAINITNKKYLVSRHPSGLRPGHPFGIFSGINISF